MYMHMVSYGDLSPSYVSFYQKFEVMLAARSRMLRVPGPQHSVPCKADHDDHGHGVTTTAVAKRSTFFRVKGWCTTHDVIDVIAFCRFLRRKTSCTFMLGGMIQQPWAIATMVFGDSYITSHGIIAVTDPTETESPPPWFNKIQDLPKVQLREDEVHPWCIKNRRCSDSDAWSSLKMFEAIKRRLTLNRSPGIVLVDQNLVLSTYADALTSNC